MKAKKEQAQADSKKSFLRSAIIAAVAVVTVVVTLIVLNENMFFSSPSQKLCGSWERTREGMFSGEDISETYKFNKNGTGEKLYILPDGTKSKTTFTWSITKKKILVINGCVKYYYNSNLDSYYSLTAVTAKKYWSVGKDKFYIGENTSAAVEEYKRK